MKVLLWNLFFPRSVADAYGDAYAYAYGFILQALDSI